MKQLTSPETTSLDILIELNTFGMVVFKYLVIHSQSYLLTSIFIQKIRLYVTDSGKRDIFAHIFKIELLAQQGRVSSQL